jgi:hypothetical protein
MNGDGLTCQEREHNERTFEHPTPPPARFPGAGSRVAGSHFRQADAQLSGPAGRPTALPAKAFLRLSSAAFQDRTIVEYHGRRAPSTTAAAAAISPRAAAAPERQARRFYSLAAFLRRVRTAAVDRLEPAVVPRIELRRISSRRIRRRISSSGSRLISMRSRRARLMRLW